MLNLPEENFLGSEPKKKAKKKKDYGIEITGIDKGIQIYENQTFSASRQKKKKPTGILKDLIELTRFLSYSGDDDIFGPTLIEDKEGDLIRVEDVEAIINKYSNP